MPTKKQRVTVVLEDEAVAVLRQLSALSGRSVSGLVAEYVDLAVPTLREVNAALLRAQGMEQQLRAELVAGFEEAQSALVPQAEAVEAGARDLLARIGAEEAPSGRVVPMRGPRPVTRGSGEPLSPTKPRRKQG